ncbi:MAG: hypothetical protein HQM06_15935, partial [Magnetococcales bacterium]|nr:hypothetical protein [Magnetococcales bacterium]
MLSLAAQLSSDGRPEMVETAPEFSPSTPDSSATRQSPAKAVTPSRWRLLRRAVMALFLLWLLVLGGLLAALQQEQGQDLLTHLLEHLFRSAHSQLQLQQLRGRFPTEMTLQRLLWQDAAGNRLQIEQLRLHWSLAEILRGSIRLQLLS